VAEEYIGELEKLKMMAELELQVVFFSLADDLL